MNTPNYTTRNDVDQLLYQITQHIINILDAMFAQGLNASRLQHLRLDSSLAKFTAEWNKTRLSPQPHPLRSHQKLSSDTPIWATPPKQARPNPGSLLTTPFTPVRRGPRPTPIPIAQDLDDTYENDTIPIDSGHLVAYAPINKHTAKHILDSIPENPSFFLTC